MAFGIQLGSLELWHPIEYNSLKYYLVINYITNYRLAKFFLVHNVMVGFFLITSTFIIHKS